MKIYFVFLFCLIINFLNAFQYDRQKNTFYYTLDFPDNQNKWQLVDDSKQYYAFFQEKTGKAFIEMIVYDLVSAKTNTELLNILKKRFHMKTISEEKIKFCQYDAIKGLYSFPINNLNSKILAVVFHDKYYFYVLLGYSYADFFEKFDKELWMIVNSCQIYYDDNVVYSNIKIKSEDSDLSARKVIKSSKQNGDYGLHINWDNRSEEFMFLYSDLKKAKNELALIGGYTNGSWNGWNYFKINTANDPDYEFMFWKCFYQEMFNKNYYRIRDIFEYFDHQMESGKFTAYEMAEHVMKCLQVIPYERPGNIAEKDSGTGILDFFTPNQTALYAKGDCDTKSLFMVLILRRLGYDAVLFYSPHYSHVMVGLNIAASGQYLTYRGIKYYFIESTYPGWKIGHLPPGMNDLSKWRVVPLQ